MEASNALRKRIISIGSYVIVLELGFVLGNKAHQMAVNKKLDKLSSMLSNAFASVLMKTVENDLSPHEVKELLDEELEFINIALL